MRKLIAIGLTLLAVGCGAKQTDAIVDSGLPHYTWWQDVQPIVSERCLLCHGAPPLYGAPRSLVTYADTQAKDVNGALVHTVMAARVMASENRMPPSSQMQLTDGEREIIRVWSLIGAPEGTPPAMGGEDSGTASAPDAAPGEDATQLAHDDAGTTTNDDAAAAGEDATTQPGEDAGNTGSPDATSGSNDAGGGANLTTVEFLAGAPGGGGPYAIPQGNTTYTCWAFEIPASMAADQHAISFEPVIDNAFYIHHMLLFRNTGNAASHDPFDCNSWPLSWNMVAGWAPGRMTDYMPAGVGVSARPGDQFVLQAHYNGVHVPTETDQSGFRVTLTDQPGLTNAGMVWAGPIFVGNLNGANVSRTQTCTLNTPITIFSVFPHMHQTGTRITLEVRRRGMSNWTTLADINPWSFLDQPNVDVPMAEQSFSNGDQLRTTCWWDTMGRSISYGEASNDEMCFNFLYHYPLISNQYACTGIVP